MNEVSSRSGGPFYLHLNQLSIGDGHRTLGGLSGDERGAARGSLAPPPVFGCAPQRSYSSSFDFSQFVFVFRALSCLCS